MIRHIATSDAIFASSVLDDPFRNAHFPVHTGDDEISTRLAPEATVYDVGFVCGPAERAFDHHQKGGPRREDSTPFGASRLIWQREGQDWLRSQASRLDANAPTAHCNYAAAVLVNQYKKGRLQKSH